MLYSFIVVFALLLTGATEKIGTLKIRVTNIDTTKGELSIGLYDTAETFCGDTFVFAQNYTISEIGVVDVEMENIPYGTYALAMYQDINLNGVIDKNRLGIPKEPYAFSNNIRSKWAEPTFEETKFTFDNQLVNLEVAIRYWKEQ